jgi:hypothetical protein
VPQFCQVAAARNGQRRRPGDGQTRMEHTCMRRTAARSRSLHTCASHRRRRRRCRRPLARTPTSSAGCKGSRFAGRALAEFPRRRCELTPVQRSGAMLDCPPRGMRRCGATPGLRPAAPEAPSGRAGVFDQPCVNPVDLVRWELPGRVPGSRSSLTFSTAHRRRGAGHRPPAETDAATGA